MQKESIETFIVSHQILAPMNNDMLLDILAHKTRLLMAATVAKLPDSSYIQALTSEVEIVQAEIKKRMTA
jgi:hypothetical protein